MNKLLIGGAAAALVVAIAPGAAQPAPPPPPGVASGTAPALVAPQMQMRVMHMTNKTMTRDEVVNHVRDMFARLDTNRDGYLTREEIDAVGTKMMGMHGDIEKRFAERGATMPDRGAMFDGLDANHDGSISRQEYMAAQPQLQERRVFMMREGSAPGEPGKPGMMGMHMHGMGMHMGGRLFDMADANHDGRVSLAEAQAAMLAHFDKADLNHDGKITPEERSQAHQFMRQRRTS